MIDGAVNTVTAVQDDLSVLGLLNAFDVFLDPVYHLADINFSCFVGA